MKIIYAPRALRDIDAILALIRERSPRGAHNVALAIEHTVGLCAMYPRAVGKTDFPELFRRPLGKYRYTIFYRVRDGAGAIEVARDIHSARVKKLTTIPEDD